MSDLVILKEDRVWAEERIKTLEKEIQDLGPEFYDALNQSSESWHDNAPFDAAREKQSVLFAEYSSLKQTLRNSTIHIPKHDPSVVGIGSIVKITDSGKTRTILIAGDWTYRAGSHQNGRVIVSAKSPIAQSIIGQKVGAKTRFGFINEITEGIHI